MTLFQGIEILDDVQKYGGIVGVLLLAACGILYRNYLRKDAENKALTEKLTKTSQDNIKVLTSLESVTDHMVREMPLMEGRLSDTFRSEIETVRELIIMQKHNLKSQLDETKGNDDRSTPTA